MSFFQAKDKEGNSDFIKQKLPTNILYDNSKGKETDFVALTDVHLTEKQSNLLAHLILKENETALFKIAYVFDFIPKEEAMKGNITSFYKTHCTDLKSIINPSSKVLVFGRSMFAITGNPDLVVDTFHDFIFNKTYFFDPNNRANIFPVGPALTVIGANTFDYFFFQKQIKFISETEFSSKRIPVINISQPEDVNDFLKNHPEESEVAVDIETSGLDFQRDRIGCVTLSFDGINGYYLPFDKIDKKVFSEFLKNKYQIYANGKFDNKFLKFNGIKNLKIDFDTYQAGHVLNEMRHNSLKIHSWLYTYYGGYEDELDEYRKKYPKSNYLDIPTPILMKYATMDACVTFQVHKAMKEQIKKCDEIILSHRKGKTLSDYYYGTMIPAVNTFVDIEMQGMNINWNKLEDIYNNLVVKAKEAKERTLKAFKCTEEQLNIDSAPQLSKLISSLGWKVYSTGKTGQISTGEEFLTKWAEDGHEAAKHLLEYRKIDKLLTTFIGNKKEKSGMWSYKGVDDKIHSNFGVMIADTGRNTSSNPNLQNIPKHGEIDVIKSLRKMFSTLNDEYYLCEADFSGFQLRLGAALSNDKTMRKIFTELSGDMHSMTAQSVLKRDVTLEEFLKRKKEPEFADARFKAKSLNFQLEFGATSFNLATSIIIKEWSLQEIEDYIAKNSLESKQKSLAENQFLKEMSLASREERIKVSKAWAVATHVRDLFFEQYSGLREWIDTSFKFGEDYGYMISPFGAIRRMPELLYKELNDRHKKHLLNLCPNSPIQNMEAYLANSTIIAVYNYIKENNLKSRIAGTVHDSIVIYLHKDEVEQIVDFAKEYVSKEREEFNGIPMLLEFDLADYWNKGEVWGFGSLEL